MSVKYVSIDLQQIRVEEALPAHLYLHIDNRFILFRSEGDVVDRNAYDRLEFKKVSSLFIQEQDLKRFQEWVKELATAEPTPPPLPAENKDFIPAREEAQRKVLDIFQTNITDKQIATVVAASKKLVGEVMKFPYAVQSLGQLQIYSKGTVDHSVNVAILSVYLAMQMGYSHAVILQNVGLGALLHDIGKSKIPVLETDSLETIAAKMKEHPTMGMRILEKFEQVPNEVRQIVAQHHELYDGSGYPKKLRGSQIYDLTRIVAIANVFDELVTQTQGTLPQRQKAAVATLTGEYFNKLDPDKLEKAAKILKLGV